MRFSSIVNPTPYSGRDFTANVLASGRKVPNAYHNKNVIEEKLRYSIQIKYYV
jgi:hypothetical protein